MNSPNEVPNVTPIASSTGGTVVAPAPTMSVAEASCALGLSKNATYRAIARGEIPSLRFGRRIVVPRVRLRRLLDAGLKKAGPVEDDG